MLFVIITMVVAAALLWGSVKAGEHFEIPSAVLLAARIVIVLIAVATIIRHFS